MADLLTTTPTTSPIGSTPVPGGKYTSEKLFLQLDTTEFNNHESDINNNGQIAFVSNGDSSFIYAKGVKVGGTDIKVEDLKLDDYATKNYVTNAINNLDVTDAAEQGKYVSTVSQENGKIKVTHATLPPVQTVSVGSQNSITINGIKYTLDISNGVLSISEDIPVTFNSFSVSPTTLATTGSDIDRGTDYVGTSYTGGTIQKTVNDTNITLTASVSNPQRKSFDYEFKDESGKVIYSGTSTNKTGVSYTVKQRDYFNDGDSVTIANGTRTWANRTASSTIGGESETFSCKINNGTPITAKVTGGQYCSFSAKAKVPVLYSTDNFISNVTVISDIVCGNTIPSTLTFGKGINEKTIYIAIPQDIKKTISSVSLGIFEFVFNKSTTKNISYKGSNLKYDIYISNAKITLADNATISLV